MILSDQFVTLKLPHFIWVFLNPLKSITKKVKKHSDLVIMSTRTCPSLYIRFLSFFPKPPRTRRSGGKGVTFERAETGDERRHDDHGSCWCNFCRKGILRNTFNSLYNSSCTRFPYTHHFLAAGRSVIVFKKASELRHYPILLSLSNQCKYNCNKCE